MPKEKSAGAVIFRREDEQIYYLLLHYASIGKVRKTYWGFPKGRIEQGETEIETAEREIKEETGLEDIKFIEGFKEVERYFFRFKGENIFKTVIFYLAQTQTKEVKISFEHIGYKWLGYQEALKQLTFKNAKEILKKANDYINSKWNKFLRRESKMQNAKL